MQLKKHRWLLVSVSFFLSFPTAPLWPFLPQTQWSRCNQWWQRARRGRRFRQRCILNVASRGSGNLWELQWKSSPTSSQPNSSQPLRWEENRAIVTAAEFIGDETGSCYLLVQQTALASVQVELDSIYPWNQKNKEGLFCFSSEILQRTSATPFVSHRKEKETSDWSVLNICRLTQFCLFFCF